MRKDQVKEVLTQDKTLQIPPYYWTVTGAPLGQDWEGSRKVLRRFYDKTDVDTSTEHRKNGYS